MAESHLEDAAGRGAAAKSYREDAAGRGAEAKSYREDAAGWGAVAKLLPGHRGGAAAGSRRKALRHKKRE